MELETSFSIQLGRGIYDLKNEEKKYIGGRLDLLCKADNKNLFIIELKAETVEIDIEIDRKQGLSYARLLNPMPPFVMVTNGKKTYLFDTLSGLEIDNNYISSKGFEIAIDSEINFKYEALKSFIGYSSNNLKIFCNSFNAKYLENFRSKNSDTIENSLIKKYIPETYVNRSNIITEFKTFLNDSNSCIFPVIGESGVGKTNTIINIYETFIDYPAVFYSGTLLGESFFNELKFDFNLEFSPTETELSLIKKISSLTKIIDKPFIIYLDALDEWIAKDALYQLENLTKILIRYNIKLCISCKDIAWASFLTQRGIPTLFSKNLFPVFKLENFNDSELLLAVNKYSEKFHLKVNGKKISSELKNPFSLRIACEVSYIKGIEFDLSQNSRETLEFFIKQKVERTHDPQKIHRFLIAISKALLDNDMVQMEENIIRKELGLNISGEMPLDLFSSNLLYKNTVSNAHEFYIGFYFSKIRDHIISIDVLDLINKIGEERIDAILNTLSSHIGENAINYFLRTGTELEVSDCVLALIKYDEKNAKSSLFRLLAQQDSELLSRLKNDTLQSILNHVLFIVESEKNDYIIGREITLVLSILSSKNDLDSFLIELLLKLNSNRANNYDISPDICRMLQKYDNPDSTNQLKEILIDREIDDRIRRFVIDSLDYRTFNDKQYVFETLLNREINGEGDDILFYAHHWYGIIESIPLRNKLIDYFDKANNESIQFLILRILTNSKLGDTGDLLFSRFLMNKYSGYIKCWLCRTICSNNYSPSIPKFIELLKKDPASELAEHVLIGLGEMNAKETMPALFEIIENLNENVDTWWLSMSFSNIAEIENYEKLVEIYQRTSNLNTRYFIILTLSQTRNPKYNRIIIDSLDNTEFSENKRSRIISEWSNSLATTKEFNYSRILRINNEEAKGILKEREIIQLYKLFAANNELSIISLSILLNFETSIERLSEKIKTILPEINYKFQTRRFHLINIDNIKSLATTLNPWLVINLTKPNWSNNNFLFNCIQFAGIFGDNKVLESIISNRDKIIKGSVPNFL